MTEALVARLAELAVRGETTHYGALAQSLGLRVAEVTAALETLMEEDAAAGLPLRAALVSARGSALPARGFFDKAVELGFDVSTPEAFVAGQRALLYA